jgi:hypothetical protein
MRRHGNLWPRIIAPENIALAFDKAKKRKAKLRGVINFEKNVEVNLARIHKLLVTKTFSTAKYTSHVVYEPKKRIIYALPFSPDRVVQWALMLILGPIWAALFIPETYSCLEGRGIHAGSLKCLEYAIRNKYCLQGDISKFYLTMNHEIAKAIVRQKIKCPDTLWLLDNIIDSFPGPVNIPIGNLTSQWLGNLYMNELDQYCRHVLGIHFIIRYCDDFLVFDNDKTRLKDWGAAIREFLKTRLELTLSMMEVYPTAQLVDFLGYRHSPEGYILLRKSTAKRFKRKLRDPGFEQMPLEYKRSFLASMKGWAEHADCYNFANSVRLYERIAEAA